MLPPNFTSCLFAFGGFRYHAVSDQMDAKDYHRSISLSVDGCINLFVHFMELRRQRNIEWTWHDQIIIIIIPSTDALNDCLIKCETTTKSLSSACLQRIDTKCGQKLVSNYQSGYGSLVFCIARQPLFAVGWQYHWNELSSMMNFCSSRKSPTTARVKTNKCLLVDDKSNSSSINRVDANGYSPVAIKTNSI